MNKKQAIKQRQAKLEQEIHAADILRNNLVTEPQTHRTAKARRIDSLQEQIIARHEAHIESLFQLLKKGYEIVEYRESQIATLEKALEERDENFYKFVAERNQDIERFKKERDAIHDDEKRKTDVIHMEYVDEIWRLHGERVAELVGNVEQLEERIKELEGAATESAEEETQRTHTVLAGEVGGATGRTQKSKSGVASEGGMILELVEKGKEEKEAKIRGKSELVERAKQETKTKRRGKSEEPTEGRCVVS